MDFPLTTGEAGIENSLSSSSLLISRSSLVSSGSIKLTSLLDVFILDNEVSFVFNFLRLKKLCNDKFLVGLTNSGLLTAFTLMLSMLFFGNSFCVESVKHVSGARINGCRLSSVNESEANGKPNEIKSILKYYFK